MFKFQTFYFKSDFTSVGFFIRLLQHYLSLFPWVRSPKSLYIGKTCLWFQSLKTFSFSDNCLDGSEQCRCTLTLACVWALRWALLMTLCMSWVFSSSLRSFLWQHRQEILSFINCKQSPALCMYGNNLIWGLWENCTCTIFNLLSKYIWKSI